MKTIVLATLLALTSMAQELPRKAGVIGIALPDGRAVNLTDYHGKVICLAFILTT